MLPHSITVTMSGENVDLMTYPPLLKLLRSGFHDLTITLRPHQNAHQRWIHTEVLRVRVNLRLSCGFSGHSQLDLPFLFQLLRLSPISVLYCAPANRMFSTASYERARAWA